MTSNLDDILADYETSDRDWAGFRRGDDSLSLGDMSIVVDGGAQQALIDVGWDDQGVTVDVRLFEDREQVEATTTEFFGITEVRVNKEE